MADSEKSGIKFEDLTHQTIHGALNFEYTEWDDREKEFKAALSQAMEEDDNACEDRVYEICEVFSDKKIYTVVHPNEYVEEVKQEWDSQFFGVIGELRCHDIDFTFKEWVSECIDLLESSDPFACLDDDDDDFDEDEDEDEDDYEVD